MKFSIIIAAYNLGKLVCDAIESCINQTGIDCDEYEIITINDGSKDDTINYINKYRAITNHTIIDKPNCGLSHTRNYGINIAKGDYILFLDGDDWLAPDALASLAKHTGKHDVIAFPMLYYHNEKVQKQKLSMESRLYSNKEFLKLTIGKKRFNIIPAQKKTYRRTFLMEYNIRFVEGILHEDNPFFIDVISNCNEVFYINTPLYFYRQNREGSITSQCTIRNFEGTIKGIEQIEQTSLSKNKHVRFLISNLYVFQIIGNYSNKEDKKKVYSFFRKWSTKEKLIRLLFSAEFNVKSLIRHILLTIDPALLKFIVSLL